MKKISLIAFCLFVSTMAWAQKNMPSLDEHNKYIYYQVVEMPGLTADTLQARALYFLKTSYPANKVEQGETSGNIKGTGRFLITNTLAVVKHIYGEVDYDYCIECKDGKYRYWLNGFVYVPHKTDRYGNSVPEQGLDVPMEEWAKKLEKHNQDICFDETATYFKAFGDKLKQAMVKVSALSHKEAVKKVIVTKDW
jgi:hypothetical protein